MDGLLRLFIGRDEQVAAAAALIEVLDGGVLWLSGKPGMGKSAFMAKLVRDYFQRDAETGQPRADLIAIPYFFQGQDGERCRTSAFAEAALLHLARATDETVKPDADPDKRLRQFETVLGERAAAESAGRKRKIVVFLDGVDEVMGVDGRLLDLVFRCRHVGLVWVCASRDEEPLRRRFSLPQCQWFFECQSAWEALGVAQTEDEGLLPPLRSEDIRGYFIEELGHRQPQFFARDVKRGDTWSNDYVEEVIRRSAGLPLYMRLLVQDLGKDPNAFAPGSEQRLPRGLEEYYDRIIDEMGDDLAATMPAITTLLALAYEPLPVETLAVLLGDHELVGQADGRQLLEDALRHGSVMLRRAPASSGVLGYTLYHASFKQHVLQSERVRRSRAKAQERFCNLVTRWERLKQTPVPLDYSLRYGVSHVLEEANLVGLCDLVHSKFLFAQAKAVDDATALIDGRRMAERLANAGDEHWNDLVECASQFCELSERMRVCPSALEDFICREQWDRVQAVFDAEPDETRRGLLQLAAAELCQAAGHARMMVALRSKAEPTISKWLAAEPFSCPEIEIARRLLNTGLPSERDPSASLGPTGAIDLEAPRQRLGHCPGYPSVCS